MEYNTLIIFNIFVVVLLYVLCCALVCVCAEVCVKSRPKGNEILASELHPRAKLHKPAMISCFSTLLLLFSSALCTLSPPLSVSFTSALTPHGSYLVKEQKEVNHTAMRHEYFISVWITIFSKESLFNV